MARDRRKIIVRIKSNNYSTNSEGWSLSTWINAYQLIRNFSRHPGIWHFVNQIFHPLGQKGREHCYLWFLLAWPWLHLHYGHGFKFPTYLGTRYYQMPRVFMSVFDQYCLLTIHSLCTNQFSKGNLWYIWYIYMDWFTAKKKSKRKHDSQSRQNSSSSSSSSRSRSPLRGIQKCNCYFTTAKHLEFFVNTTYQENCGETKLKYRGARARINHGKA